MRVAVIGAGLGGLSAACHLGGLGYEVVVFERDALPGGRAGLWSTGEYAIDTGPSVLTMATTLAGTFAAAGADMADHLDLRRVDPMYRACFADGDPIYVRWGRDAMAAEIAATCGTADAAAFGRFCDWLTRLYRLEQDSFIGRNYDSPLDLLRPPGPALRLLAMGGFRRMSSVVNSFFADHRLRKLFSFQALYAGLSPFDALAIYCSITYMDTVEGVWMPAGGIHAVARALAAAAAKAGATFRYGCPVDRIERKAGAGGAVGAVRLEDGERIEVDAVVCNMDLPVAYRRLLPDLRPPWVTRHGSYSPSCVLWLGATRGNLPAGAAHHNIHFGRQWRESFDALLRGGARQPDPSILVSAPTVTDPGLAPPGGQVLYILEPVPNLDGRLDWRHQRDRLRDDLLRRCAALGYPVDDIHDERFIDPVDWQAAGMERGTPFALSHRFFQTGPFRPNNVDRRVPGLVFVGSGTVPGVSVPMVLVSGRLAAERVQQWAGRR